jgi:hypothetical protein
LNFLMGSVLFRIRKALAHLVLASACSWVVACPPAHAAPSSADVKKAAEAFDRGREAFRAESYVEAAEHFEAADAYAASAASLRLAIAARKEAGQLDRALTLAALALSTYPGDETVVSEAQAVIDAHQADFGRVQVTCDEECELLLDGKLVHGPPALSHTVYVSPGSYQVQANWSEERTDEETVTVVAGDQASADLTAPPVEVEPPPPPPPAEWGDGLEEGAAEAKAERHGWSPVVFWTSLGVTLVGVGVTTGLGVNAINNPGQDAVRDECVQDDQDCPLYQQGVANQTAANVAAGLTAAVGVFTIVSAFATDWGGGKSKSKAGLDPTVAWSVRSGRFSVHPTLTIGAGATLGAKGTF